MDYLGINMADYQSNDLNNEVFFGSANTTQEKIVELAKALEAEEITGRDTTDMQTASGAPLKLESLDKTLKVLTYRLENMTMWRKIPKLQAYNTVEEYNQLQGYGADTGGFINEGELPIEEDSTYVRRAQLVKFIGVTKSVTHPLMLVNTMVGNVLEQEVKNGMLWVLRKLNRGIALADSTMIPQEFNGIYSQHQNYDQYANLNAYMNSNSVLDLRGDYLKEKYIETANEGIVENYGIGTELFAPPKVLSDFAKNFYGNKFIMPNTDQTAAGIMGQKVNQFDSQYGRIGLNWDIFLNQSATRTSASAADSANAPGAVTSLSAAAVPATVTDSLWGSDAGTYYYGVTAVNRFGESTMTVLGSAVTVVANGAVDLTWTANVDGLATAFRIYRGKKGDVSTGTMYPIFYVSVAQLAAGYDGASAAHARDNDRWLPNTNQCFLIQNDEEVVSLKLLAPLMKMSLAVISPAYRFMVLAYATPMLYANRKVTRVINIGAAS